MAMKKAKKAATTKVTKPIVSRDAMKAKPGTRKVNNHIDAVVAMKSSMKGKTSMKSKKARTAKPKAPTTMAAVEACVLYMHCQLHAVDLMCVL